MKVTRDISDTRAAVAEARKTGRRVGLVPTMGALHRAHVSLMEAARRDEAYTVVSIFVNPTQFGPNEDYQKYPREEAGDLRICQQASVDLVFMPPANVMYRNDAVTEICVAKLTETLCGESRSGHFVGVATVCAKLFNIVQPDLAYFGQKDAQQLAVIRRMVRDLDMPLEIVGCPTIREDDGLAVSSRNNYLSASERQQAGCLYRALCQARQLIQAGEHDPATVVQDMQKVIDKAGSAEVDYLSLVEPESMQPVETVTGSVLVALAVRIGPARLIDNMLVDPAGRSA